MDCSLVPYNTEQMAVICMNMLNTKLVAAIKAAPKNGQQKVSNKIDEISLKLEKILSSPDNAVISNIIEHTQFKRQHGSVKRAYHKLALQFRYVN